MSALMIVLISLSIGCQTNNKTLPVAPSRFIAEAEAVSRNDALRDQRQPRRQDLVLNEAAELPNRRSKLKRNKDRKKKRSWVPERIPPRIFRGSFWR